MNEQRREKSFSAPRASRPGGLSLSASDAVQRPRLVFFGSGPVGLATLRALLPHFEIEAVVTKPKAPYHRGPMPVLDFSQANRLSVFTPTNKNELTAMTKGWEKGSQLGVVVDYGLILPKQVIEAFAKGLINSHFSLLPKWRGADPISFAILNGDDETGVSLMLINERLDEGWLLSQEKLKIKPNETTPRLTDRLIDLSSKMLIRDLPLYLNGQLKPYPQPNIEPSYSRLLKKSDGLLDLGKPAELLEREVRAYAGWPRSRISLEEHDIIVTKAKVTNRDDPAKLILKASPGYLEVEELIAPSGRRMSGADFLRGHRR